MRFKKHVFICTHERAAGEKQSCGEGHGMQLVKLFKQLVKEKGLNTEIRAQKSGCLDACEFGPSMVVYPEGIFYGKVTIQDVAEIVEEHLNNDRPVERLIINFSVTKK
jgi:(2Fe-2S) ferredoxin